MDRIEIRGLRVFARHGVLPEERDSGQHFLIDVEMELDTSAAADADDLSLTVDYAQAASSVAGIVSGETFNLIEALAARICDYLLTLDGVQRATVSVKKPEAPLPVEADWVGVKVTRERSEED